MRGTVAKQLRRLTRFHPNLPRHVDVPAARWYDRFLPRSVLRWAADRRPKTIRLQTKTMQRRRLYRQFKKLRKEANRGWA